MRLKREARTVAHMVSIYCRDKHGAGKDLCPDCEALRGYALARIDHCRFGDGKPVCAKCRIHCYKADMRERIRAVMRYSGPRMLLRHPILALWHLVDSIRSNRAPYGAEGGKPA